MDPHSFTTGILQILIGTTSWIGLGRILSRYGSVALAGNTIGIRIIVFAFQHPAVLSVGALLRQFLSLRFRQPERRCQADQIHREGHGGRDVSHFRRRKRPIGRNGKRGSEPGERRPYQATANIGGEALSGSTKVDRIDARQIVPPETELGDRHHSGKEDPQVQQGEVRRGHHGKDDRQNDKAWNLKDPYQLAAACDAHDENGEDQAAH